MEGSVAIQHSHDLQNSSDMQDFERPDQPQSPFSDDDLHLDRHHAAPTFVQTNLISDGFVQAQVTDPNLINPWGLSFSPTSPLWISDNGTGLASVDNLQGGTVTLNAIPASPVTIPPPTPGAGPATPDGTVSNSFASSNAFMLSNGQPALFLFATEDGTIAGWNKQAGNQALLVVNSSANAADGDPQLGGAVYKGLAIADTKQGPMLYAANFRHGTVDMFDQNFNQVKSFTDPKVPAGFAPFNVQVLDGRLFVTYAMQDDQKHDDVAGAGNGFVDEFSLDGHFMHRVASGGALNSPWGLAIAPQSFGAFAGDLLVGNFGDGTINVYDRHGHDHNNFDGQLLGADGKPIVIGDLWAITPGNGGAAGDSNTLYFTAGVTNEAHGLFGSIAPSMPT
jgi:uncharacterized protein (TIGR03118 family)